MGRWIVDEWQSEGIGGERCGVLALGDGCTYGGIVIVAVLPDGWRGRSRKRPL